MGGCLGGLFRICFVYNSDSFHMWGVSIQACNVH